MNGWRRHPEDELTVENNARKNGTFCMHARVFSKDLPDNTHLTVIRSYDEIVRPLGVMRWHLSVSHRTNVPPPGIPEPGRRPSGREIREILRLFAPVWPMQEERDEKTPDHIVHYWEAD